MSSAPEAPGSGMDYFAAPVTAATPVPNGLTSGRRVRGPLGWMMARRRNVLIVYAFGFVLMMVSFFWPTLPEHTYLQVPQRVVGLDAVPVNAFYGVGQTLQTAIPAGRQLAAEYDTTAGQPGAYSYAEQSSRPASAIPAGVQAFERVLQRDLPGSPFTTASPGSLGGRMDCATATIFSQPAIECAFADTHVAGVVVLLADKSSHSNVIKIRQAVEQRTTSDPPGTKTSRTGRLLGGCFMTVFALLFALFGPRYLQFINDHPELQLIPMRSYSNLAPTKMIFRIAGVGFVIAGLAFIFTAL